MQDAESIVDKSKIHSRLYLSLLLQGTRDEFNGAVKDANKHLKSYCRQNGWKLIQHLKITENGLIKGGLHLSYKGIQNIFNNFNAYK